MTAKSISTLTIRFDDAEDRIALFCRFKDEAPAALLHLTRRMAERLARTLCEWLASNSQTADTIQNPGLKREVMQMEHVRAVQVASKSTSRLEVETLPTSTTRLVTQLQFRLKAGSGVGLLIACDKQTEPEYGIFLEIAKIHWLVNRLTELAEQAQWSLPEDVRDWALNHPANVPQITGATLH